MDADSAYTERYMGLPNVTDNYKGYEEAELIKVADQLRDKQYLLVGMEGRAFHDSNGDDVNASSDYIACRSMAPLTITCTCSRACCWRRR